jgi:hypothetical protein
MGGINEKRGKLSNKLKEYVVQRLAAYDSPGAIVRSLEEDFGITVSRTCILHYDPTRSRTTPARWRELFFDARKAIVEGKAASAAASAMVRLSWREDMVHRARAREAFGVADRILNSIAREVGDVRPVGGNPDRFSNEDRLRALMALVNKVNDTSADRAGDGPAPGEPCGQAEDPDAA